jgi:hypothetical protein
MLKAARRRRFWLVAELTRAQGRELLLTAHAAFVEVRAEVTRLEKSGRQSST